jgi:hypothetical protein
MTKVVEMVLTDKEQRVIIALCAALQPSKQGLIDPGFPDLVIDVLETCFNNVELKRVKQFLWLIENPIVNLVVLWTLRSFSDMIPSQKKKYLVELNENRLLNRLKVVGAYDTIKQAIAQSLDKIHS